MTGCIPARPPALPAVALAASLLLVACGGGGVRPGDEQAPGALNLTFEEAAFIASGAPTRFYGEDADPVPVRVRGERGTLDGERVWRVHMTVEFTRDGERVRERWVLWVGTRAGKGAVLRTGARR